MTVTPPLLPADPTTPPAPRHRGLVIAGVAGAAVVTVYLALVAATGDGLPRGAHVLGVDVGGLSQEQATVVLTRELGPRAKATMTAVVGTDKVSIAAPDAGLGFDAASTVEGYAGRIWNPVTLLTQFTGGPALDPVVTVDEAKLAETVDSLAADSDAPAAEPVIVFAGTSPALTPGTTGTVLDKEGAADAIRAAYLVSSDPVTLPVSVSAPSVSQESAEQALAAAKVAVSAPVTVQVDSITATIPASSLAEALTYKPKDGTLAPTLSGVVLRAAIADKIASIETPGNDASWTIVGGKPVVLAAKVGRGVNADLLAADVVGVLDQTTPAGRRITAQIGTIEPKLTTAQAKALGVVEQVSTFTQKFPYAAYRFQNIGQAAKSIDGTVLLPGQTFSLNDTLGERTVSNGYTKGFVVGPGGVFKEDLGGGVSTSATTTWTAAFYAGLQRVHTQAHSIWIPRYRAGLEATVAWGSFDMSFKNDTKHAVYITTTMRKTSLTVTMWGTKDYDRIGAESSARTNVRPFSTTYDSTPECHAQGGQPGFTITVTRVFYKGGAVVKREPITTTYRPAPTVICGTDPAKATPTPTVSSTAKPGATTAPPTAPAATTSPKPSTVAKPSATS